MTNVPRSNGWGRGGDACVAPAWTPTLLAAAAAIASAALGAGCAGGVRPSPPVVPASPAPDPSTAIVRVRVETSLSDTALIRQHIALAWATGAAAQAVSTLAEPVAIGEEAWLLIAPRHFGIGPSSGSADPGMATGLALSAGLRIVVGSAPPPAAIGQITADTVAADSAFEVIIPIDVPYSIVRAQLAREFRLDSGGSGSPRRGRSDSGRPRWPLPATAPGWSRGWILRARPRACCISWARRNSTP